MFRLLFSMIVCLGLAAPSHAFFTELLQAADSLLENHESEIKKGDKTLQQIAEELDKKLAVYKERVKSTFEKIAQSNLISPKLKQSLLDALTVLEEEVTGAQRNRHAGPVNTSNQG